MNKEDFYKRNILEGPFDDPYTISAGLLPDSLCKEYISVYKEYSEHLEKFVAAIDCTGNMELRQLYLNYEQAANAFHAMSSDAMFLYGAEIMEKECAHSFRGLMNSKVHGRFSRRK